MTHVLATRTVFPEFRPPADYPRPHPYVGDNLEFPFLTNSWAENAITDAIKDFGRNGRVLRNRIVAALPWYWIPVPPENNIYLDHSTDAPLVIKKFSRFRFQVFESPKGKIKVHGTSLCLNHVDDLVVVWSLGNDIKAFCGHGSPYATFITSGEPVVMSWPNEIFSLTPIEGGYVLIENSDLVASMSDTLLLGENNTVTTRLFAFESVNGHANIDHNTPITFTVSNLSLDPNVIYRIEFTSEGTDYDIQFNPGDVNQFVPRSNVSVNYNEGIVHVSVHQSDSSSRVPNFDFEIEKNDDGTFTATATTFISQPRQWLIFTSLQIELEDSEMNGANFEGRRNTIVSSGGGLIQLALGGASSSLASSRRLDILRDGAGSYLTSGRLKPYVSGGAMGRSRRMGDGKMRGRRRDFARDTSGSGVQNKCNREMQELNVETANDLREDRFSQRRMDGVRTECSCEPTGTSARFIGDQGGATCGCPPGTNAICCGNGNIVCSPDGPGQRSPQDCNFPQNPTYTISITFGGSIPVAWFFPPHTSQMEVFGAVPDVAINQYTVQYGDLILFWLRESTLTFIVNLPIEWRACKIPEWPDTAIRNLPDEQKDHLREQVEEELKHIVGNNGVGLEVNQNPYDFGVDAAKLARLLLFAGPDALDFPDTSHRALYQNGLEELRMAMNAWFEGTNSLPTNVFQLQTDEVWGGVVVPADAIAQSGTFLLVNGGRPTAFGNSFYNDHHYQYGYFIYAIAALEHLGQDFYTDHSCLVEQMIRDIANPCRGPDAVMLRHKDIWAGHSWGTGVNGGVNRQQESSTEAIHAYYAVYLLMREVTEHGRQAGRSFRGGTDPAMLTRVRDAALVAMMTELIAADTYYHFDPDSLQPDYALDAFGFSEVSTIGIQYSLGRGYVLNWISIPFTAPGFNTAIIGVQSIPFVEISQWIVTEDWVDKILEVPVAYRVTPDLVLSILRGTYEPLIPLPIPNLDPEDIPATRAIWAINAMMILAVSQNASDGELFEMWRLIVNSDGGPLLPIRKGESYSNILYWMFLNNRFFSTGISGMNIILYSDGSVSVNGTQCNGVRCSVPFNIESNQPIAVFDEHPACKTTSLTTRDGTVYTTTCNGEVRNGPPSAVRGNFAGQRSTTTCVTTAAGTVCNTTHPQQPGTFTNGSFPQQACTGFCSGNQFAEQGVQGRSFGSTPNNLNVVSGNNFNRVSRVQFPQDAGMWSCQTSCNQNGVCNTTCGSRHPIVDISQNYCPPVSAGSKKGCAAPAASISRFELNPGSCHLVREIGCPPEVKGCTRGGRVPAFCDPGNTSGRGRGVNVNPTTIANPNCSNCVATAEPCNGIQGTQIPVTRTAMPFGGANPLGANVLGATPFVNKLNNNTVFPSNMGSSCNACNPNNIFNNSLFGNSVRMGQNSGGFSHFQGPGAFNNPRYIVAEVEVQMNSSQTDMSILRVRTSNGCFVLRNVGITGFVDGVGSLQVKARNLNVAPEALMIYAAVKLSLMAIHNGGIANITLLREANHESVLAAIRQMPQFEAFAVTLNNGIQCYFTD